MTRSNIPRDGSWIDDLVTGEVIGWRETYGIHSLEILPMEENRVPRPPLSVREFNLLAKTARDALQAAGEQTDEGIAEPFVLAQTLGGVRDDRPIHDALRNWFEDIISKHGKLSRLSFAARFLATGRIMVLANRPPSDPAGWRAVCDFAQAWRDWHMEISGVHATAFYGKSRAEDFTKCTTTKASKKETRDAIILQQVEHALNAGTSCRGIAKRYFENINAALHARRCKHFSNPEALEQKLLRMKRLLQRIKQHP
jgi:hypothetical protein